MKGRGALMECVSAAAAAAVVLLNEHTGALLFMCRVPVDYAKQRQPRGVNFKEARV
jgi:hypothetical protein